MKKTDFLGALALILIFGFGAWQYLRTRSGDTVPSVQDPFSAAEQEYKSAEYGFSFRYPGEYVLTESLDEDAGIEKNITLVHKDDLEPRENSEGPTSITFQISSADPSRTVLENVQGNPLSQLANVIGDVHSATVDDVDAVYYRWSGLYEGESFDFVHRGKLITTSVTFISPEDQNAQAYRDILDSLVLQR